MKDKHIEPEENIKPKVQKGFTIVVEKNDLGKNLKSFNLVVSHSSKRKWNIQRSLVDLVWLRDNLRKDFPFEYVTLNSHNDL